MSSSFEKLQNQRTIAGKQNLDFCSTPVKNARRPSNISISAVDTNSSSSTKGQHGKPQVVQKAPLKKRIKKRKQLTGKSKREEERSQGDEEKKKEERQKKKTKKKKKTLTLQVDSDNDWETYDETFRQPSFKVLTSGSTSDFLFKSPERIREAPRFADDHLDSPPFPFTRQEVESPEKISFSEKERTLPLKELPSHTYLHYVDTDEEEDSLNLRKENTIRTYLGMRPIKPLRNLKIEKCKEWLVDVSIPTASSDLLWDDFVENNRKEISKYLAPSNNDREKSLSTRHPTERNNETDDDENEAAEEWYNLKNIDTESGKKMDVAYGYCDKSSRKWIRCNNVYNFPEEDDADYEVKDEIGERVTLNQFLKKCRVEKKTVGNLGSSSSSPIYRQSTEKKLTDLRRNFVKKRKHGERSRGNSQSDSKMFKKKMVNVAESELQRIHKVRKFASRLHAKKKTIISNATSLATTSKNSTSDFKVSPLKRVNTSDINDRKDDCNRRKQINTKNKPKIKNITLLTSVQFERNKHKWRITNAL